MAVRTDVRPSGSLTRQEWLAAAAEVAGLLLIFVVAFSGRDQFSDTVKDGLTALSVVAGAVGAMAGLMIARRGLVSGAGRGARLGLGAFMAVFGIYTIVHVLS